MDLASALFVGFAPIVAVVDKQPIRFFAPTRLAPADRIKLVSSRIVFGNDMSVQRRLAKAYPINSGPAAFSLALAIVEQRADVGDFVHTMNEKTATQKRADAINRNHNARSVGRCSGSYVKLTGRKLPGKACWRNHGQASKRTLDQTSYLRDA